MGGRDIDIYGTDAFWPSDQARILTVGCLRCWKLAEVALPLVRYNPVTGRLVRLDSAELTVAYARQEKPLAPAIRSLTGRGRVEKVAVNFRDASWEYGIPGSVASMTAREAGQTSQYRLTSPPPSANGYVIVTTSVIRNASAELPNFVLHKENLGFTVKVVTESSTVDDYHYLSGSACDERAGNIRDWLQTHYESDQILYVLLIGNPHTTSFDVETSVPMKKCTSDPDPNNPNNHPTDYFFAELTADWDKDGDGRYGEDKKRGATNGDEVEKYFELYVGRIPYHNNISDLDHILRKTINYENSTEVQWRRSVFLPMVPFEPEKGVLSYELGEQIKKDHLEAEGICSVRIYDECYFDAVPPPEHLRRNRYPATEWKQGTYGLIVWLTHGGSTYANGIISRAYTTRLDDGHPAATWQGSCGNSEPENPDNLAYSILRHGGIASIGATGGVNYSIPERDYRDLDGSVGGMAYEYAKRLVRGQACGEALYNTKEAMNMWLGNYYSLNLYGDPSLVVMPEPPALVVSPTDAFYSKVAHSRMTSSRRTYSLMNTTDCPLSWAASASTDWLGLSSDQGIIDAHSLSTVEMHLTSAVAHLDYGSHEGTVVFADLTNDVSMEREATVEIYAGRLVGYWKLDETDGETAKDAAGDNDGLLQGDPRWQYHSRARGGGLLFDGADDYVDCGRSTVFDITDTITAAAWVTIGTVGTDWQTIVSKGDSAWRLSTYGRTRRFHFAVCGSPWVNLVDGNIEVPAGEWHHVCGTYDGQAIRLYVDGVLDAGRPNSDPIPANTHKVYIGANAERQGRFWDGLIDDVRIYNRALDVDEIKAIMDGGHAENLHPFDGQRNVPQRAVLTWVAAANTVTHHVYFGTSREAVVRATIDSPEYMGRQIETSYVPFMDVNTQYFWRIDEVPVGRGTIIGDVWSFTTGTIGGTLTRAVWTGRQGSSVADLTNYRFYPGRPNILEEIPSFEGPTNWGDHYGTLMHGFLTPPRTGSYTFWIAGDNNCELWLSSDANPANQVKIAEVPTWANPPRWEQYSEQESDPVTLTAGMPYYIKALQKEHDGGDSIAVSWQGPGISQQVIQGQHLAPYDLDPPSPDPTTWVAPPHATGSTSISMTAVTALDRGGVEYHFDCTSGGGDDSGWQDSPHYQDGNLNPNTVYTYVVTARDKSHNHNLTGPSEALSARTCLAGDFEPDGDVDFTDYAYFARHFSSPLSVQHPSAREADLDGDGDVDFDDLLLLARSWLATQP